MAQATYETKIQKLDGRKAQDESLLNQLGSLGWMLVSVVVMNPDYVPWAYLIREKK